MIIHQLRIDIISLPFPLLCCATVFSTTKNILGWPERRNEISDVLDKIVSSPKPLVGLISVQYLFLGFLLYRNQISQILTDGKCFPYFLPANFMRQKYLPFVWFKIYLICLLNKEYLLKIQCYKIQRNGYRCWDQILLNFFYWFQ